MAEPSFKIQTKTIHKTRAPYALKIFFQVTNYGPITSLIVLIKVTKIIVNKYVCLDIYIYPVSPQ